MGFSLLPPPPPYIDIDNTPIAIAKPLHLNLEMGFGLPITVNHIQQKYVETSEQQQF